MITITNDLSPLYGYIHLTYRIYDIFVFFEYDVLYILIIQLLQLYLN